MYSSTASISSALLEEHGRAHEQRRDVERVRRREVGQPCDVRERQMRDERGVTQFDGVQERLIQADEHRNLDDDGEAAAGGLTL